jgi:hypothetical protein
MADRLGDEALAAPPVNLLGRISWLVQEISNTPELARSYVRYARLVQGWGEEIQARAYLTQAISLFQQTNMAWDLAQVEQVLHALP